MFCAWVYSCNAIGVALSVQMNGTDAPRRVCVLWTLLVNSSHGGDQQRRDIYLVTAAKVAHFHLVNLFRYSAFTSLRCYSSISASKTTHQRDLTKPT